MVVYFLTYEMLYIVAVILAKENIEEANTDSLIENLAYDKITYILNLSLGNTFVIFSLFLTEEDTIFNLFQILLYEHDKTVFT